MGLPRSASAATEYLSRSSSVHELLRQLGRKTRCCLPTYSEHATASAFLQAILLTLETFTQVGQIVGAFGLKGFLKIRAMTDFLERFEVGSRLWMNGDWFEVEAFKIHKNRPMIKLKGVESLSSALALNWSFLEISSEEKPTLDEGEFIIRKTLSV